jgi:hypothetical protein
MAKSFFNFFAKKVDFNLVLGMSGLCQVVDVDLVSSVGQLLDVGRQQGRVAVV